MRLDLFHHLRRGPAPRVARPGDAFVLRQHDRDFRFRTRIADHHVHRFDVGVGCEPALIGFGIGHGGRQGDAPQTGRQPLQPRHGEREEIAALAGGEGVHLVHHDGAQVGEQERAVRMAEEQGERFRRGEQDVRRLHPLPRLALRRRVAGACLDPDRQAHLLDRRQEIAPHVHRKRLQRRDIEGVKALKAPFPAPFGLSLSKPCLSFFIVRSKEQSFDKLRTNGRCDSFGKLRQCRQESCQRLSGAGGRHEQGVPAGAGGGKHFELVPARRPALGGEPVRDNRGQARGILQQSGPLAAICSVPATRILPPIQIVHPRSRRAVIPSEEWPSE